LRGDEEKVRLTKAPGWGLVVQSGRRVNTVVVPKRDKGGQTRKSKELE